MAITKVEIDYWNFEDEKSIAIMYCIEDIDERGDNFDRTFICFESEDDIKSNTLELIEKNRKDIHKAVANLEKIEDLIENNQIRHVSHTHKYWEDVRLFVGNSRFHYAEDVYNLTALELEINKFIKKRFYGKDHIIDACDNGDTNEAMQLLYKGKFTKEEMEVAFEISPKTKEVFEKYQLHDELKETLQSNENVKEKTHKI